jgi:predicted nucleotidyltransferase
MNYNLIIEKIKEKLPNDVTLLFVSVSGSRGKGIEAPDSDYDVRVIIMSSKEKYMLQKAPKTISIKTEVDGVVLEGVATDLLAMLKYATETNPMAYETFGGIQIFTTNVAEEVQQIFHKVYRTSVLRRAFTGQIYDYIRKDKKLPIYKNVMEMAYLALRLKFIQNISQEVPPPYKVQELVDAVKLPEAQDSMVRNLIKMRMLNKNAMFEGSQEFDNLIDEVLNTPYPDEKNVFDSKKLQKLSDDLFLSQFN